jgi:hypothetical protein
MYKKIFKVLSVVLFVSLVSVPLVFAYPAAWNPDPKYPDFWQQDPLIINGAVACGPTAATNSLYWLADKYNLPNLKDPVRWQNVANRLGNNMKTWQNNGTYSGDFAAGKWQYITDQGYGNRIVQKSVLAARCDPPPTVDWIKNEIAHGEDVEILIGWVKDNPTGYDEWQNGHYVSVTGWSQNGFTISDPWNNNNSNSDPLGIGQNVSLTLGFDEFGNPKTAYTKEYVAVNLGLWNPPDQGVYEVIFAAVSQSPVPEPSLILLVGSGLCALVILRRRLTTQ